MEGLRIQKLLTTGSRVDLGSDKHSRGEEDHHLPSQQGGQTDARIKVQNLQVILIIFNNNEALKISQ